MVFWVGISGVSWGQSPLSISGNQTWSVLKTLAGGSNITKVRDYGVVVLPGATFTIDEELQTKSEIRVHSGTGPSIGGKLVVQSKVTNVPGISFFWLGIVIDGAGSTVNQFSVFPKIITDENAPTASADAKGVFDNTNHGLVILDKKAVIQNALVGINVENGGIVSAYDVQATYANRPVFLNCHKGIKISNYSIENNAYRLNTLIFRTNNNNPFVPSVSYDPATRCDIKLDNVASIFIGGCEFESIDQTGNTYGRCWNERGTGISSTNSNFKLGDATNAVLQSSPSLCPEFIVIGNSNPPVSKFTTETSAIVASGDGNQKIVIDNVTFTNNLKNITTDNIKCLTSNSKFNTNSATLQSFFRNGGACGTADLKYHILLTNATTSVIYNNIFDCDNTLATFGKNPAIKITGANGNRITVQKNTINGDKLAGTNPSTSGIDASGNLGQFEWLCNTLTQNEYGVKVNSTSPVTTPIADFDAGNTYSNINEDIQVLGAVVDYKHNGLVPSYVGPLNAVYKQDEAYCDLDCQSDVFASVTSIQKFLPVGLWPMPVCDYFYLDNDKFDNQKIEVTILDALGKTHYFGETYSAEQVNVARLSSGVYFVYIKAENHYYSAKLIKR